MSLRTLFYLITRDHTESSKNDRSRNAGDHKRTTTVVAIEASLAVASSARPRAGTSTALVATRTLFLYFSSITLAHGLLKNACRPGGSRWNALGDSLSNSAHEKNSP